MPLLKLDKASLHYGTQVLLDEVELSITRGDKLGLLGRNGAGKTTLLKILAGEQALDSGAVITDECSAIEAAGKQPIVVTGSASNLKITHPEDLEIARVLLESSSEWTDANDGF